MTDLTGLGRRFSADPRDKDHLLPRKRQEAAGVTRRHWYSRGVLDQGSTSQCVIYSIDKFLTTGPVTNTGFETAQERARIYKEVQKLDEWPGENYDGTSVRAGFKWLKEQRLIYSYKWAFEVETIINHVLTTGPVVMGTIWDEGLSNPNRWDYIASNKDDADDEGHAWTIVGADREKQMKRGATPGAARMIQSWGDKWADDGRAWLEFSELAKLVALQGEAAVAVEVEE